MLSLTEIITSYKPQQRLYNQLCNNLETVHHKYCYKLLFRRVGLGPPYTVSPRGSSQQVKKTKILINLEPSTLIQKQATWLGYILKF